MATYREIHGKPIKFLSSDLDKDNQAGEIFYNSTSDSFKSIVKSTAWTSSGSLIQDYRQGGYAGATQSAYMIFGGYPVPTSNTKTFEYNGVGWTTGGDLGTGKYLNGGAGTQTAGLDFGGYKGSSPITIPGGNVTQEYDGSSWSNASAAMGTARYNLLGSGTQTAALSAAGISSPPANAPSANNNFSEEYNGSSWSEGNNLNTPRNTSGSQSGTQTAAIMFGGLAYPSSFKSDVENYDGTSWTSGTSLPAGRSRAGTSGTQTDALVYGGALPSVTNTCFSFDGTTFSTVPSLATARQGGGNSQNAPSGGSVLAGGSPSPKIVTEEFTSSTTVTTAAAFSSGGSMGNARYGGNFFGSGKSSQVAVGGQKAAVPPTANNIADSETYDGTSWSEGNNMGTARFNGSGTGTETAGLIATGRNPAASPSPQVYYGNTEEYNGTSYSEVNDCPQAAYRRCGAGTQTATIIVGGLVPPASTTNYSTTSNEYDGTNWSSGGAAPFKANYMDGVGVTTAAVVFGGQQDPSTRLASYDYDGTSWTANNNMNIDHGGQHLVSGTVTDAIIAGGGAPYALAAQAETYDGTTFTTNATLATGGQRGGRGSTTANAIGCGGYAPGYLTATEEYTAASTGANVKTITTS